MAFLVWRGFLFVVILALNVLVRKPTSMLKSVLPPVAQPPSTKSMVLTPILPLPNIKPGDPDPNQPDDHTKLLTVDSTKKSGIDSGSEHSEFPRAAEFPTPDHEVDQLPLPIHSMVCQAHLVTLDRFDGVDVPP